MVFIINDIISSGGSSGSSGGVTLLAQSNAAVSLTGTTTETTLATYTLPANTLGTNGMLRITVVFTKNVTSAGTGTPRIRFGGTSGTAYIAPSLGTTVATGYYIIPINANNSTSAQKGCATNGTVGAGATPAIVTSSVNTTAAVDIVISGQLAVGTDTLTLEGYTIELIK